MKMQTLELAQLVFGSALVQLFLIILQSLCFGMVMCIPCHYILKVCDLLDFDFYRGITIKKFPCVIKETLDFKILLSLY